jgi:hypothetical protein
MFTTASAYAITIHFPFKARYRPQPIPGHEPIFLYDGPYAGLAIRWRSLVTELQAACWSFSAPPCPKCSQASRFGLNIIKLI